MTQSSVFLMNRKSIIAKRKKCKCGQPKQPRSKVCIKCFHKFGLSKESLLSKSKKERRAKKKYSKRVVQFTKDGELLAVWDSVTQAGRILRVDRNHIRKACQGKLKTSAGFKWKYE